MNRWLSTTLAGADDLKRTLAAFDGSSLVRPDGYEHVLATFQKLSKQLAQLQASHTDPAAAEMLRRHFAVPSAVTGLDNPAAVPSLLSTRLDKEQEDQTARRAQQATGEGSEELLKQHNRTIKAARNHLAATALALDLPGAAALELSGPAPSQLAPGGGASSATAPAPAPAPAAAAASQAVAHLLVSALRDGRGLERPPPKSEGGAAHQGDDRGEDGEGSRKRPRK